MKIFSTESLRYKLFERNVHLGGGKGGLMKDGIKLHYRKCRIQSFKSLVLCCFDLTILS